jgi:hypothetical protein
VESDDKLSMNPWRVLKTELLAVTEDSHLVACPPSLPPGDQSRGAER